MLVINDNKLEKSPKKKSAKVSGKIFTKGDLPFKDNEKSESNR